MYKVYLVRRVSNIVGHSDYNYVLAANEKDALKIGLSRLNHLAPMWEQYCRYYVDEVA